MGDRIVQFAIIGCFVLAASYAILRVADGWADWAVLGGIILTVLGFAIAVAPRLYARRRRTISRSSSAGERR